MFNEVFSRRSRSTRHRRTNSQRMQNGLRNLHAALEELESRRVLAVSYLGVSHTNYTGTADEEFTYEVRVTKSGVNDAGELWMRYNRQYNRIDFDDNSDFANISNVVAIRPLNSLPSPQENAPFSAPALRTVIADWNGIGSNESFSSASVNVIGGVGTKVILANGDDFPLGLSITLAVDPSQPSFINLDGPINTTANPQGSYDVDLAANSITVSAAITDSHVGSRFRARDKVEIRNRVNIPRTDVFVSDGDFQLIAGASIQGGLGVFTGLAGSGTGLGGAGGDIVIDGDVVSGGSVTLQATSISRASRIVTGPNALISGSGSLTLLNSGLDGGKIDVRTSGFSVTNVNVGSPVQQIPDIGISIDQTVGNLTVAAVPRSRGQISLTASAAGGSIIVNSDINTAAGLALTADRLTVGRPISTQAGNVTLTGNEVDIGSNVYAGTDGVGAINITSRTGGVTVSSAAVVSAKDETITIDAKTNLSSLARLEAQFLDLKAGGSVSVKSNARELKALSATGITVDNADSLVVRTAVTTGATGTMGIDVSAKGFLDVATVSSQGTGAIMLNASAGLRAKDIRTKNGSATLSATSGDVELVGTVVVEGALNDLTLNATTGNVIVDPKAILTVSDQVVLSAPQGRVLTPGEVTGIIVDQGGTGYTVAPDVKLAAGEGSVAKPVVTDGALAGFDVINGGSGYVTAPNVRLVGGGGTNATAQAFISNGSVVKVVVTNPGTGYTSAPQVILFDGSGSGAEVRALINGLSSITVENPGSGYLVPPEVIVSSGDGATVSPIKVNTNGEITAINLSTGGFGYGLAPLVEIFDSSGAGSGAAATASLTTGVTSFQVSNGGSGYTSAPEVELRGGSGTGARAEAIISGSVVTGTGFIPTNGGSGYSPNPQVVFRGDGTGATGTATINGSVLTGAGQFTLNGGSGYSMVPGVAISLPDLPGGVPATATATLGLTNDSFNVINVPESPTNRPTLYSVAPTVTISGGGGTGAIARAILTNGLVSSIQIVNPGTGYTSTPQALLTGGLQSRPGTLPQAQGNDTNFTVSGLSLTGGSGYSQLPTVTFSAGNASADVSVRGPIVRVDITNGGNGYSTTPTIDFVDPQGVGAIGPAASINARVIALRILAPGSGYGTTAPTVHFSSGGGSGANATVGTSSVVSGIAVNPGQGGRSYNPATTAVRLKPVAGGEGAVAGAISVDGSGRITGINIATGGQNYVAPPVVIISDSSGAGRGAVATAVLKDDKVVDFSFASEVDRGLNYNPATTTVTLQSIGNGATAVANLDSQGRVASVTVTNSGAGYSSVKPPSVRLIAYGQGASATATVAGGAITGFTVSNPGSNYAVPPKVAITGLGTGAAGTAVISNVATVNASRLSWTALESPLDALTSQFSTLAIHLTGAGDVLIDKKTGVLNLEGASTKNGSVTVIAPILTVKGAVTIGDFDQQSDEFVDLRASAGDLAIDAPVGNLLAGALVRTPLSRRISLSAPAGAITASMTPAGLVTAEELVVSALSNVTLRTDVGFIRGGTTSVGAGMTITQNTLDSNGNPLKLTIGNANGGLAANDGTIRVTAADQIVVANLINAGSKGSVVFTAAGRIVEEVSNAAAEIVAESVSLESTNGKIDLDTSVARLSARAPLSSIDIDNVAGASLEVVSASSRNGIRVSSLGSVSATNMATTNGPIEVRATGVQSDIDVGRISAPAYPITLAAGRSIRQSNMAAAALIGSDALLTAGTGTLDIFVDVTSVSATAPESISIRDAGSLQIAGALSSNNKQITLTVGGTLSQSAAIRTAGALVVMASAGEVLLTDVNNDVGSFTASNPGRGVTFRDANALDIGAAGITGGAVALTVGGQLTQTGAVTASSLSITSTAVGPIAFINTSNDVDTISIVNAGNDISFTDRDDVAIRTFTGRDITITSGGALTQAVDGAITSTGTFTINSTGAKQPITLTGANDLTRFSIDNGTQPVALNDINDLEIGSITAGGVTLSVGGKLTQAANGAIEAPSLSASSTSDSITLAGNNNVGTLSVSNPGRAVTFRDVNALAIAALSGGAVQLTVGGGLTQTGAITASSLRVDASAGDIVLNNAANTVGSIAGTNPGRGFTLANNSTLTQSAGVVAGALSISNGAGDVLLAAGNDVGNLSIVNGGRSIQFNDSNGVNVTGLTGGNVQLTVGGSLTQSSRITATDLSVSGTGGSVMLTREDNAVGGIFTATNPSGSVSFFNASGVRAGRVVAGGAGQFNGNVHLKAVNGGIQLTDDVVALDDTVKLEARNGTITQAAGKTIYANSVVWFAQAAPTLTTTATQVGQNLTLPGATLPPIVNNSVGTITIYDNSAMQGDIVVTAPNAAKVIIAGALTAGPGGKIDLRGINPGAVIEMRGDGDLQGTQVLVRSAATTLTWIVSGANASDAGTSLFNVVNRANSVMPKLVTQAVTTARRRAARTAPRAQPTRMSTISAEASTIEVQQSLPVLNVPVTFVTPATIIAGGNAVSGSGLRLAAGASGSRLSNLAFQGFAGTGVELDRVQKAMIQGVQVNGGTTGISVTGLSTGTRILGNTFRNVQTGLSLTSASRLTFGGRRAGEANRIENAAREGVFATGFSTGTQLIKTQFVGGSSAIVTRNVRGLRIIK